MFLLAILLVTLTGAYTVSVDPDMEMPVRSDTEEDIFIFNSMNINPLVNYRYLTKLADRLELGNVDNIF